MRTETQPGGGRTAGSGVLPVRPTLSPACGGNPVARSGLRLKRLVIGLDEAPAIRIVPADWRAAVAAIQNVANRPGIFDSQLAGHESRVATAASYVNFKTPL